MVSPGKCQESQFKLGLTPRGREGWGDRSGSGHVPPTGDSPRRSSLLVGRTAQPETARSPEQFAPRATDRHRPRHRGVAARSPCAGRGRRAAVPAAGPLAIDLTPDESRVLHYVMNAYYNDGKIAFTGGMNLADYHLIKGRSAEPVADLLFVLLAWVALGHLGSSLPSACHGWRRETVCGI